MKRPKGAPNPDEPFLDAALREFHEETGLYAVAPQCCSYFELEWLLRELAARLNRKDGKGACLTLVKARLSGLPKAKLNRTAEEPRDVLHIQQT